MLLILFLPPLLIYYAFDCRLSPCRRFRHFDSQTFFADADFLAASMLRHDVSYAADYYRHIRNVSSDFRCRCCHAMMPRHDDAIADYAAASLLLIIAALLLLRRYVA